MGERGRDLIALLAAEPDLAQRLGEMVGEVAARAEDLAELAKGETVLAQRAALGAGEAEGSDTRGDALLESGGLGWRNGDGRFHGKKSTGAPRCPRNARLCAAALPPEEEASNLAIREHLPPRRRPCRPPRGNGRPPRDPVSGPLPVAALATFPATRTYPTSANSRPFLAFCSTMTIDFPSSRCKPVSISNTMSLYRGS